jgi:hypothetical protein
MVPGTRVRSRYTNFRGYVYFVSSAECRPSYYSITLLAHQKSNSITGGYHHQKRGECTSIIVVFCGRKEKIKRFSPPSAVDKKIQQFTRVQKCETKKCNNEHEYIMSSWTSQSDFLSGNDWHSQVAEDSFVFFGRTERTTNNFVPFFILL